jgi:hypothetical protein
MDALPSQLEWNIRKCKGSSSEEENGTLEMEAIASKTSLYHLRYMHIPQKLQISALGMEWHICPEQRQLPARLYLAASQKLQITRI